MTGTNKTKDQLKIKNYAKICLILGVPPTIAFDKCALKAMKA